MHHSPTGLLDSSVLHVIVMIVNKDLFKYQLHWLAGQKNDLFVLNAVMLSSMDTVMALLGQFSFKIPNTDVKRLLWVLSRCDILVG